jgi:hypothetical protein
MDLIYKIGEFYLYDNQFNWDYLILYNRRPTQNQDVKSFEGKYCDDINYEFNSELPFEFNWSDGVFNQIFRNANDIEIDSKSVQLMSETCKGLNLPFIKVSEPGILNFVKKSGTHIPNYNGYHIYFNETLSGIDITKFELAAHWTIGKSHYSTLRLFEFAHCREESLDIIKIQQS